MFGQHEVLAEHPWANFFSDANDNVHANANENYECYEKWLIYCRQYDWNFTNLFTSKKSSKYWMGGVWVCKQICKISIVLSTMN